MSMSNRVLSIQSHVAFGYVGGKAAVFPLQCLGYDVDVINTVNFSNHSGYGRFGGSRASAAELREIFRIMDENGLLQPSKLLTGYISGAEALSVIKDMAEAMKRNNPDLIYILDPVLGDSGRLYISPDAIPIYRQMLPLATIITPNWFEVETLTDIKLEDIHSLRTALTILHTTYNVQNVVISSIPLKPWLTATLPNTVRAQITPAFPEYLLCISSTKTPQNSIVHTCAVPCLPGYFSGVGDLFSALVLAHFDHTQQHPQPTTTLSVATTLALTKTHSILTLTHTCALALPSEDRTITDDDLDLQDPSRKIRRMRGRELRLVQGQEILRKGYNDKFDLLRKMELWQEFWELPLTQ